MQFLANFISLLQYFGYFWPKKRSNEIKLAQKMHKPSIRKVLKNRSNKIRSNETCIRRESLVSMFKKKWFPLFKTHNLFDFIFWLSVSFSDLFHKAIIMSGSRILKFLWIFTHWFDQGNLTCNVKGSSADLSWFWGLIFKTW